MAPDAALPRSRLLKNCRIIGCPVLLGGSYACISASLALLLVARLFASTNFPAARALPFANIFSTLGNADQYRMCF